VTPEAARDFYYEARLKAMNAYGDDYKLPVNQNACDLQAWAAVIRRIENNLALDLMDADAFSDKDRTPDGHQGQH